ncbi:hypothetical protein J504_2380 [Acinetobacter baumannii 348935]|nr:hypothetical protein J504_2380 [Acinetobacter baumannii 348935]
MYKHCLKKAYHSTRKINMYQKITKAQQNTNKKYSLAPLY